MQGLYPLKNKEIWTEKVLLYVVVAFRKAAFGRFDYATKFTRIIAKDMEIRLPYTQRGGIDFAYMESRIREMEESRIREMEESRIREMEAYLKVAGFEDCELTEEEKYAQPFGYNYFRIGDLFNIHPTTTYKLKNNDLFSVQGSNPVVCNGSVNNGVAGFSTMKTTEKGNMITFSDTTTSSSIFYQPDDYVGYPHVQGLYDRNAAPWNETSLLYFLTAFRKCAFGRFDYATKFTRVIASNMMVCLPITSSGSIDYKFMETYIRAIEKQTIQRVKDWRAKEIKTTKNIVKDDTESSSLKPLFGSKHYEMQEEDVSMMVADNIFIPYSVEVRLWNTKREDLFEGNLDLLLMYAIGPSARHKNESACKIALGIKETNLSAEAIKAFKSVRYIMFHYWKNSEATPFELTAPVRLVEKKSIPEGFLIRQEKDAKQYLLIEYDSDKPAELGEYDILRAQRRGSNRYIPFVCRVENIKVDKNDRQA